MINNNYYLSIDDNKIESNSSILCYIVIQKCLYVIFFYCCPWITGLRIQEPNNKENGNGSMSNNPKGLPLTRAHIERIFPKLTDEQISRMQERGHVRAVKLGEVLVEQGDSNVPFFVVMSGEIEILRPSGDIETLITVHGPGQFTG